MFLHLSFSYSLHTHTHTHIHTHTHTHTHIHIDINTHLHTHSSPCCPFTPRSPFNPFCPLGPSLPCVWYTNIYQSVFPHMCICVYIHTWVYCSHVKECPWVVHCTYPPKSGGWAFFEHFCIHLRKRIHICVCNCACWLASATLNNNHLFVSLRCISV